MKVRLDFVTNSSSSSYAAGAVSAVQQVILLGALLGVTDMDAFMDLMMPGRQKAKTVEAPAPTSGEPDRSMDWDDFIHSDMDHDAKLSRLDREIENYRQEWEDMKDSLAEEDYAKTKKEYEDYMDYLRDMKDAAEEVEYQKEVEKAMQQAAEEARESWIDQRKDDYVNTQEDISFIKANIAGYKNSGMDISDLESRLEMLEARAKQLKGMLKDEDVEFNYTAKTRAPIGPDPELMRIKQAYEQKVKQIMSEAQKRKRKDEIRVMMRQAKKEFDEAMADARQADKYLKVAETVQVGADMAVDGLAMVTGPAGKTVKIIYLGAKGAASGGAEAYYGGKDVGLNIAKGFVKGGTDIAKELVPGGKYAAVTKGGITIVAETTMGAIDGAKEGGGGAAGGALKGLVKGGIEVAGDAAADKFMPGSGSSKNWSSATGGSIKRGYQKSYKFVKDGVQNALTDTVKNQAAGQAKNFAKGEGVVYGDLKHNLFD